MNERLQELADSCQKNYGLDNYYLERYHLFRDDNSNVENAFLFSMEWVPRVVEGEVEEGLNPPGTAVIEIELESKKLRHFTFVQDANLVEEQFFPQLKDGSEAIIEWVEETTALEFGRQFQLKEEAENGLRFLAAADNIPVFPVGTIEVMFNEEGKLSQFSMDGSFPQEDQVKWEPFALTSSIVDPIILNQLQLLEIPIEEEERWLPVFGTTTTFITNDKQHIIPFEKAEMRDSYEIVDRNIEWDSEATEETFVPQEIDLSHEVSLEEALANKPDENKRPLTPEDIERSFEAVGAFTKEKYPEESGKWKLYAIFREHGYLIVEIWPKVQDKKVIQHKLKLFIDPATYRVLNFTDNEFILEMFNHFSEAESPVLTRDKAFEKLHSYIEITPVYIYEPNSETYQLCGKVDCSYGVNASTGDVILLDEL
ncbi:hypothetical protein OPHB3_1000 [Oceanobacillus picturae]|uniref:Uncharacterized protein n=1 Tax=Oceanobacillus picturae TaxID=171693 RepID=A0A0U9H364_9BACI|nr:hypothetical protein [Oceanobacillus picturae]GAQ17075.1 hypothetical protein OPHB3_1000 [Oceanobacillus picturae]